jgi:hypothetical protein
MFLPEVAFVRNDFHPWAKMSPSHGAQHRLAVDGYRICSTNTAWHTWSLAAGLMDFDLSGTGTAVPIVFRGWAIR